MKRLLFLLFIVFMCLSAAAQTEIEETPQKSIVVSRYADDMTEIPVTESMIMRPHKRWWFGINSGFSYMLNPFGKGFEAETKDFLNKMRSGLAYGLDIHYTPTPSSGFGIRFAGQRYAHSQGGLSDEINFFYLGPSSMLRHWNRKQTGAFVAGLSAGFIFATSKVNNEQSAVSGVGLIGNIYIGYDFRIMKKTYLSITLTANKDLVSSGYATLNLGIGLRF